MKLLKVIKAASVAVLALVFYPIIALISGIVYDSPSAGAVLTLILCVLCCLGCGAGSLLDEFSVSHPFLGRIFSAAGAILSSAMFITSAGLLNLNSGAYCFFGGILAAAAFVLGCRAYPKRYNNVIPSAVIPVSAGTSAGSMALLYMSDREYSVQMYTAAFLIILSVYAFAKNQGHIDMLMDRRRHSASNLPAKIRGYNLFLTAVILLCGILLLTLRKHIAAALASLARFLLKAIITGVLWLFELLGSAIPAGYSGNNAANQLPEAESVPAYIAVLDSLLGAAALCGIIYLLLKYHNAVDDFLHRVFSRICSLLAAFFSKKPHRSSVSFDGYTDTVEYVPIKSEENRRSRLGRKRCISAWKRKCSRCMRSKTADPAELYKLILHGARLAGAEIPQSATAFESAAIISSMLPSCSDSVNCLALALNEKLYGENGSMEKNLQNRLKWYKIIKAISDII